MTVATTGETAAVTPYRWVLLAGVWLIYFSFGLLMASTAALVGPMRAELGVDAATMGAIMGAWPLVYILAAIPCGALLDRFGPRAMLLVSALIMAASGMARAYAGGPAELYAAVALFGLGGPLISIGAPTLIARWFEGPSRGTAMGVYMTGPWLGSAATLSLTNSLVMPALGGDWRDTIALYAGLTAAAGLIWLAIASAPAAGMRRGAGEGGKKFNIAAFADLLRVGAVRLILAMSVGIFFVNHGLNNWLPELLKTRGLDAADAGYLATLPTLVGLVCVMFIPRLATPARRLRVLALLFVFTTAASLLLHAGFGAALVSGLVLQGVARSSMMTIAILLLMETPGVPKERLGLAGGLFFTTAEIGGVLGPLTLGALLGATGDFTIPLVAVTAVGLLLLASIWALARMGR